MGSKPLRIRFDEIDRFIKIYDGIRPLVLFGHLLYDEIYDRYLIRYLISEKSSIKNSINDNFARIRIYSYNCFPIEIILTVHNVIIFIKSVVSKNNMTANIIYFQKKVCIKIHNTQYL